MTKKYRGKSSKGYKILMTLCISGVIASSSVIVGAIGVGIKEHQVDAAQALIDNARYEDVNELMLKTSDGRALKLSINKGEPIGIVVNGFNSKERQILENAIKDIDDVSETIDYIILDEDDPNMKQKVYITNNIDLSRFNAYGVTYTLSNENTATICYPVSINLKSNLYNIYSSGGENLLSHVVKHEMLHTLGFADLYEKSQLNETIMYYSAGNQKLVGLSDRDENAIRTVYDYEDVVDVELPESTSYLASNNNLNYKSQDVYVTNEDYYGPTM